MIISDEFAYFLIKSYVMGTQKNRLIKNRLDETVYQDGSFEHPKHMFKLIGNKINTILLP